eukprot:m.74475 g.74475  ORF g.74475 m.74475 type:complete len:1207 (-) comp12464_c0_seq1:95-3715(-)
MALNHLNTHLNSASMKLKTWIPKRKKDLTVSLRHNGFEEDQADRARFRQARHIKEKGSVWVMAIDNKSIYTSGFMREITEWDLETGKFVKIFKGHSNSVRVIALRDGHMFSAGDDSKIIQWDMKTCQKITVFEGHKGTVNSIALRGRFLFSAGNDQVVKKWNLKTGKTIQTFKGHTNCINQLAIKDDILYSGGDDNNILAWETTGHEEPKEFVGHTSAVKALVVNDKYLYSASVHSVIQWNRSTRQSVRMFDGHTGSVKSLALDTAYLYSAGDDGIANQWSVETGELVRSFDGHENGVNCIAVNENALFTASSDQKIIKWTLETNLRDLVVRKMKNAVHAIAVEGNEIFCGGGDDNTIIKYEIEATSNSAREKLRLEGHTGTVKRIIIEKGFVFSSGSDEKIIQWNRKTGEKIRSFEGHSDTVKAMVINSKCMFSADGDGDIFQWNIRTGIRERAFEGHTDTVQVLYLTESCLYSGSDDGRIGEWDLSTGESKMHTGLSNPITALAVSKNHIFAADETGCIMQWVQKTGSAIPFERIPHPIMEMHVFGKNLMIVAGCEIYQLNIQSGTCLVQVPFPEQITSVALGVDNLYVGLKGGMVIESPHFIPWMYEETLPTWILMRLASVDSSDPDPQRQYRAVSKAITRFPSCATTSWDFFKILAEEQQVVGLERCLFEQPGLRFTRIPYGHLLRAALNANSGECIKLVLRNVAFSVRNSNDVADQKQTAHYQLALQASDHLFVPTLLKVAERFPSLLLDFLNAAPLLRAADVVQRLTSTNLSEYSIETLPSDYMDTPGLWDDIEDGTTMTESLVTPFPGFMSAGKGSFMFEILARGDPKLFGTLISTTVIEHKWKSFGRRKFMIEAGLHLLIMLVILVMSAMQLRSHTFDTDHIEGRVMLVGLIILGISVVRDVYVEVRLLLRGSESTISYVTDVFNWIRAASILSILFSIITFLESPTNFEGAFSLVVFFKWFGSFYYLQPVPKMGPVVRMIVAILFDIKDILLAMSVATLALAHSLFTLLYPVSEAEGFNSPLSALYTTYKMLFLVEFDDSTFILGHFRVLINILFVFSSLLGSIVLLNLLIARMSDSYERIQDEAEMERRRLQARIIAKYESLMGARKLESLEWFPEYLHVLVARGKNLAKVEKREWAGVLNDVKEKLGEKVDFVESKVGKVNMEITDLKEEIARMDVLLKKILTAVNNQNEQTMAR